MMLKRKSRMPVVSVGEELDAAPLLGGVRFSEGGNNSPNTGTYGEAIMNELIPAIEQRFRHQSTYLCMVSVANKIAYSTMVAIAI
jgi:hypothetical protein